MKVPLHIVHARRDQLAQLLQHHRYMPLAELCDRLKISEATARRDLAALARDRVITRTRGGSLVDFNQRFPPFRDRQFRAHAAKRQIALAARKLIEPGMTCFFDAGTTVYAIAEALHVAAVAPLVAVTNNLPVAEILGDLPGVEVQLLGGRFLSRQSMLLGKHASGMLRHWKFDLAFLGAEGMSQAGLWDSQRDIIALRRAVMGRTPRCIFCLDSTKLGVEAAEFLLPWTQVRQLLTDASLAELKTAGIKLNRRQYLYAR